MFPAPRVLAFSQDANQGTSPDTKLDKRKSFLELVHEETIAVKGKWWGVRRERPGWVSQELAGREQ